jgi:glyoxylase-like metal-dependent hydrolase (beta-lactamase superfamily II)
MIFLPIYDVGLGCSSFVIGDETTGQAFVVDPLGSEGAENYLMTVQELGLNLTLVVETHVHADHLSSARELAGMTSVPIVLSRHAPAVFPFQPVADGDILDAGAVRALVWETPGHTPDSISLIISDRTRGGDPWAVLTGDSLFVGDVGRPDLADAHREAVEAASKAQFRSVRRLMTLPDYTEVWPAHYGSSPCGGLFMSRKPQSTIGYERRHNRALQIEDYETFLDYQRRLVKPAPNQAAQIRSRNLGTLVSGTH